MPLPFSFEVLFISGFKIFELLISYEIMATGKQSHKHTNCLSTRHCNDMLGS